MSTLFRPDLHRGLRFARTAGEAFRDASYADPIERPTRKGYSPGRWLAFSIVVIVALAMLGGM